MGEGIGPVSSEGNFNPLNGVHYQKTEFPVKDIMLKDLVKVCSRSKAVRGMILFKGEPIGGETVIVEMGKIAFGPCAVGYLHTAVNEQVNLGLKRQRGLGKSHYQPP
jgi:hypothetical protein